jgi:hypothetical protein
MPEYKPVYREMSSAVDGIVRDVFCGWEVEQPEILTPAEFAELSEMEQEAYIESIKEFEVYLNSLENPPK